jgi:hypothetical protein
VVGRAPHQHHLVADGRARPLRLPGADRSLSRAHLLVALRGWDIRVADIGSRNGTWIQTPGEAWERLPVGDAVTLGPATLVAVGERILRIDHLHVR